MAESITLGGLLLRLNRREEAVAVLESARQREPQNFMVLANLALANQLLDFYDRALQYEEEALAHWPAKAAGYPDEQWQWFRRVEKYHWQLLRLRQREKARGAPRTLEDVDGLFANFSFASNREEYGPGPAGPGQWSAELPADAPRIVEQLLIWMPLDNRLYWLLGEVLNAQGQVASAATVLDDLVAKKNYAPPGDLVRKHWRVLREAAPPPAADVLVEAPAPAPQPAKVDWLPDWRTLLVGFVTGALVALLLQMQWREFQRRRRAKNS